MALGWTLGRDPYVYLMIGIPITLAFQLFVARKPVWTLWRFARDEPAQRRPWGWALAVLVLLPLASLMVADVPILPRVWAVLSGVGLLIAAWTAARHRTPPQAWLLALAAVASGSLFFVMMASRTGWHGYPLSFLAKVVMYFGVCFLLEEVTFRGAFDPYLANGALRGKMAWGTALFVSALWGVWHFPIAFASAPDCFSIAGAQVVVFQLAVGVVLSFTARTAGSLIPSALAHAVLDAVRDAL
jgi:hypothetical protein